MYTVSYWNTRLKNTQSFQRHNENSPLKTTENNTELQWKCLSEATEFCLLNPINHQMGGGIKTLFHGLSLMTRNTPDLQCVLFQAIVQEDIFVAPTQNKSKTQASAKGGSERIHIQKSYENCNFSTQ